MKAIARTIRITPKKANLIAGLVRGKNTNESLEILKYTPKKAAKIIFKLVKSAVENAKNNFKQDENSLFIKEIIIGKGPTLKRSVPVSRGRAYPILKRTANITVLLGIQEETTKKGKGTKGKAAKKDQASTEMKSQEEVKAEKKPSAEKKSPKKTTAKKVTKTAK